MRAGHSVFVLQVLAHCASGGGVSFGPPRPKPKKARARARPDEWVPLTCSCTGEVRVLAFEEHVLSHTWFCNDVDESLPVVIIFQR